MSPSQATLIETKQIYKGQDFYVPKFEIKVGDQPLKQATIDDILEVTYKDNLEEVDSFELTINNWDAEKLTYKYSDLDTFDPGKKLELKMGYFGKNEPRKMITGEIMALRPNFPSSGQPTLVVSGLNVLHSFRKKQESHAYTKMTDTEIAREIAGRLQVNLKPGKQQEQQYPYLLQHNQFDIVFLLERAQRLGYELVVDEPENNKPTLRFAPSTSVRKVAYELIYGKSLVDFQVNLTTAKQVGQVTVRAWDPIHKKLIIGTATRNQIETEGVGSAGKESKIQNAFNQREEVIATHPVYSKAEADTLAKETLERIAKDMVKATGKIVGLPDLRAGSVLCISGLGERHSGRYFVTATTHTISDSGFTTQFECRREEIPGQECKKQKEHNGV